MKSKSKKPAKPKWSVKTLGCGMGSGYEKTILSDLQGAWSLLRDSVVETGGFEGRYRAIFHIDEAMSWETVRNLKRMPPLLLIIRNISIQGKAPQEVLENI